MILTSRRRVAVALALAAMLLVAAPGRGIGQRLGVFFDREASRCDTQITSFGRAHVWVYGFPPPDSILSGFLFRVVLPPDVAADSLVYPRNLYGDTRGTLTDGLDLRLRACTAYSDRVLLAEFVLEDRSFVMNRPNLVVEVQGAAAIDSVEAREPRLRVCGPDGPFGEGRGFIEVTGVDGVLNCSMMTCQCTTPVAARAWSAIKSLYR